MVTYVQGGWVGDGRDALAGESFPDRRTASAIATAAPVTVRPAVAGLRNGLTPVTKSANGPN
jgi:hypothetical protein